MAYNKRYNPDALPAHVEPEQVCALYIAVKDPITHPDIGRCAPWTRRTVLLATAEVAN
jgi:hypothetical protein